MKYIDRPRDCWLHQIRLSTRCLVEYCQSVRMLCSFARVSDVASRHRRSSWLPLDCWCWLQNTSFLKLSRTILSHCLMDYFLCKPISSEAWRNFFFFDIIAVAVVVIVVVVIIAALYSAFFTLLLLIFFFLDRWMVVLYLRQYKRLPDSSECDTDVL